MHDLVRMRFPQQALEELRQIDPNTPVSLSFIRRLVRTGAIPSVPVGAGKRRLLNFDALLAYLENPLADEAQTARGIRPVDERGRWLWLEENFIIIPENIYRDERLSPRAVLLYGLVWAFSNERGFCWASNAALAERLHISKSRLSHLVSELNSCGLIRLQADPETGVRHICPIAENNEGIANFSYSHCQK